MGEPFENNGDTTSKRMFAHPSYHAFFNKNDEETILILKLVAHYTDLNINISNNNIDSLVFENQKAKGWYKYKWNPIIVIDSENVSSEYISNKLTHKIPDSLKLQEISNHIDTPSKVYFLNL